MKTFRSRHNLARHMQGVHEGIRKHKCKLCERAFFRTNDLKNHTQKAHDSIPIKELQNNILKQALLVVVINNFANLPWIFNEFFTIIIFQFEFFNL